MVSGSNSYVTVSGVGVYASDYGLSTWSASTITNTMREQAIFKSMRYLEALPWNGVKSTADQSLEFPRSDLYDKNGYLIDDNTVPQAVINAQCEIAVLCLPDSGVDLQPTFEKDDYIVETGIVGATRERWANTTGAKRPISTAVRDILRGLIKSSFIVELERG
jgi:hypothetical protein